MNQILYKVDGKHVVLRCLPFVFVVYNGFIVFGDENTVKNFSILKVIMK